MLNLVLDPESEQYLVEILAQEKTTSSALIKALLREKWQSLNPQPTVLERMGGYPDQLLEGQDNLSDRDVRRALIAQHLQQRQQQQQQGS
ncbi:MAG: hypothetical protein AB4042_06925 [Leptolyngbyaceae cyanobacterium]